MARRPAGGRFLLGKNGWIKKALWRLPPVGESPVRVVKSSGFGTRQRTRGCL